MNSRHFALVCILTATLTSVGCSVTHPRKHFKLGQFIKKPRRIAILKPTIDAKVKYIDTPEFFESVKQSRGWGRNISVALRRNLEKQNHQIIHYSEIAGMLPRGQRQANILNKELVQLTRDTIIEDFAYNSTAIDPSLNAENLIPPQIQENVDLIIAVSGRVKIETHEEFSKRWWRNVSLNILTFPITLSSSLIPIPLPLSVNISTSIFQWSPEESFVSLVVIDVATKKIIFQNDHFTKWIAHDEDDFQELVNALLEEFHEARNES